MPVKLIEQHKGTGEVFLDEERLATVQYRLDVFAQYDAESVGEKAVIGQISSNSAIPFDSLLTLRLQDGKKINFYLKSVLREAAIIAPSGLFYE